MAGFDGRPRMSGCASGARGAIWYRFGGELKRGRLAKRVATRQSAPAADRRNCRRSLGALSDASVPRASVPRFTWSPNRVSLLPQATVQLPHTSSSPPKHITKIEPRKAKYPSWFQATPRPDLFKHYQQGPMACHAAHSSRLLAYVGLLASYQLEPVKEWASIGAN